MTLPIHKKLLTMPEKPQNDRGGLLMETTKDILTTIIGTVVASLFFFIIILLIVLIGVAIRLYFMVKKRMKVAPDPPPDPETKTNVELTDYQATPKEEQQVLPKESESENSFMGEHPDAVRRNVRGSHQATSNNFALQVESPQKNGQILDPSASITSTSQFKLEMIEHPDAVRRNVRGSHQATSNVFRKIHRKHDICNAGSNLKSEDEKSDFEEISDSAPLLPVDHESEDEQSKYEDISDSAPLLPVLHESEDDQSQFEDISDSAPLLSVLQESELTDCRDGSDNIVEDTEVEFIHQVHEPEILDVHDCSELKYVEKAEIQMSGGNKLESIDVPGSDQSESENSQLSPSPLQYDKDLGFYYHDIKYNCTECGKLVVEPTGSVGFLRYRNQPNLCQVCLYRTYLSHDHNVEDIIEGDTGGMNIDNLAEVYEACYKARTEWYNIGLRLIPDDVAFLDSTEDSSKTNDSKLRMMLQKWLQNGKERTWKAIIDALKHETVGRRDIADEIINRIES